MKEQTNKMKSLSYVIQILINSFLRLHQSLVLTISIKQQGNLLVQWQVDYSISKYYIYLNQIQNMNNGNKFYWDDLDNTTKQQFKQQILGVLISPIPQVMKAGAQIIAVIAAIELPRGDWQSIVQILSQNCTNQDFSIMTASITTIGYIAQQIKKSSQFINNHFSEQMLGSIIIGTRQQQQSIIQTSLKALEDSLSFLQQLMTHSKYRDTVFEVFTNNFKNDVFVQNTYQALYEFVKVTGKYLMSYQKPLSDLTQAHLDLRNNYSQLNLQLWQVIGTDYAQKVAQDKQRVGQDYHAENFMQAVSENVLPCIMKMLLIFNKEEEEDEDQMRISAARAIQAFTKVCDKSVVDRITSSVGTVLNSDNPNHQQATVVLFSTICQYGDRGFTVNLFRDGFDSLFNLLSSNNKTVIKNSLIGFVRLSQSIPEVFLTHSNIKVVVDVIYGYLVVDLHDIRSIASQILSNISEGLKQTPQPVSDDPEILLQRIVKFYADNMLKLHVQQPQINERVTAIIMNIVMNTSKRETIVQLIDFMIDQYKIITGNKNIENCQFLIEQILSVLHTAILAHKNAIPNNDLLGKLCDLVNYHFKNYGIQQEGLSLLGAIATTFNKSFEQRSNNYWSQINHGLEKVHQMATFKATLACIGDFARMLESSFFNKASSIMAKLIEYINANLDRELKLSIINCMGDLVLSMQHFAETYLDQILNLSEICFQAVYELQKTEKDLDYVDQLKASIIQMYSCVAFALNSSKPNRKMLNHFANLATFVVRTCNQRLHPTIDYLKNCLYLVYDSAAFYWNNPQYYQKVKQITDSNEIQNLVNIIMRFSDRQDVKELVDFINSRKKI